MAYLKAQILCDQGQCIYSFWKGLGIQWTGLSSLSQLKAISSTISAWKTPIIIFAEHSKPHPRSPNLDTLYVAMHFFLTHKANSPIFPPKKGSSYQ